MGEDSMIEVSYFPGCSLATSAKESNQSLIDICKSIGLHLNELDDWNCCGSSSAHSLDSELALSLCARNLSRASPDRPLMTMCPSCYRNMTAALIHVQENPEIKRAEERKWGREISTDLHIVTFIELLHFLDKLRDMGAYTPPPMEHPLTGLSVAPYNGCMAMFPPKIRHVHVPLDRLDKELKKMGAHVLDWPGRNRCCGTFLTAARPDITTPIVNRIIEGALSFGADCIVTACAMCQLNLEIRCTLEARIPVFHFTEIMALSLGAMDHAGWFKRHLVDPRPLLKRSGIIAG
jgi:heterodisulfide reductase subunit B